MNKHTRCLNVDDPFTLDTFEEIKDPSLYIEIGPKNSKGKRRCYMIKELWEYYVINYREDPLFTSMPIFPDRTPMRPQDVEFLKKTIKEYAERNGVFGFDPEKIKVFKIDIPPPSKKQKEEMKILKDKFKKNPIIPGWDWKRLKKYILDEYKIYGTSYSDTYKEFQSTYGTFKRESSYMVYDEEYVAPEGDYVRR
jgi:hypothetical protein